MSEQCGGCGEEGRQIGETGACSECEAEFAKQFASDSHKIRAFDMLAVAEAKPFRWDLSGICFDGSSGSYKATLKRVPQKRQTLKGRRQRFALEYESGFGASHELALIDACTKAMIEESD